MFWTSNGLHPIFTYIPFKVQMFLTLWKPYVMFPLNSLLCSYNCFSCGDVICGIFYLCSLSYLSCGDVIYDITIVFLTTWTIGGTALTTISTTNGSILPLIIFYAFKFMFSYSLFPPKPKVRPSSILLFFLRALLKEFTTTFFLFSSVVYISSLVL